MENRINAQLSDENLEKILQLFDNIEELMPFLIDLMIEERRTILKMGEANQPVAENMLRLAETDDSFLPRWFEVADFAQDVKLLKKVRQIHLKASRLYELIDDTLMALGSDAFSAALVVYGAAKENGRGEGLDEMLSVFGRRFARRRKQTGGTETPPTT